MSNPRWVVKSVTPLEDFRLLLTFEYGEKKVFDFKPYLKYQINAPLRNESVFRKVFVRAGSIAWSDTLDFAPECLYEDSEPCDG